MNEEAVRITKGFPIEIPIGKVQSAASVFKVYFGKKYFIWKGKALYQSAEIISKSIVARLRNGNFNEIDFMYHVVNHIKKNGITKGFCKAESVFNDYERDNGTINGYQMLIDEQKMLDEARKDGYCLNNNAQSYVPENTAYISNKDKQRFLVKYEKTHKI